ncbi:hypothetical protein KCU92_g7561, partial [Aureobasidium melanogenum]
MSVEDTAGCPVANTSQKGNLAARIYTETFIPVTGVGDDDDDQNDDDEYQLAVRVRVDRRGSAVAERSHRQAASIHAAKGTYATPATDLKAMGSTLAWQPGPSPDQCFDPPQSEPQITTDNGAALGDDEHESEGEIYTEDDESPEQDHAMHNMDDDKISDYEEVNGDVDMRTLNANQTNILTSLVARRSLNTHTTKKRHAIQQQTPASHGGAQGVGQHT